MECIKNISYFFTLIKRRDWNRIVLLLLNASINLICKLCVCCSRVILISMNITVYPKKKRRADVQLLTAEGISGSLMIKLTLTQLWQRRPWTAQSSTRRRVTSKRVKEPIDIYTWLLETTAPTAIGLAVIMLYASYENQQCLFLL